MKFLTGTKRGKLPACQDVEQKEKGGEVEPQSCQLSNIKHRARVFIKNICHKYSIVLKILSFGV